MNKYELRDLTKKIEQMEWRIQLAMQVCEFAVWEYNIDKDELIWDSNMYKIFECEPSDYERNQDAFNDKIHPDDLKMVEDEVKNAMLSPNNQFNITFRLKNNKKIKTKGVVLIDKKSCSRIIIGVTVVNGIHDCN